MSHTNDCHRQDAKPSTATDFVINGVDVNSSHDTTSSFPAGPFPFRWAESVVHKTPTIKDDSSHKMKLSLSAEASSVNSKGLNPANPDVNQVDIDDCSTHDTKPSMTTESAVLSLASNTDDDGHSLNISTQQMPLAVQECSAPSTEFVVNVVDVNTSYETKQLSPAKALSVNSKDPNTAAPAMDHTNDCHLQSTKPCPPTGPVSIIPMAFKASKSSKADGYGLRQWHYLALIIRPLMMKGLFGIQPDITAKSSCCRTGIG